LVDTLKELFEDNEPLFRGLHIRWLYNSYMHITFSETTITVLQQALPASTSLSIAPIAPLSLSLAGHSQARQLTLVVDIVITDADQRAYRLRGQLTSEAWAPLGDFPPVGKVRRALMPSVPAEATAPLAYTFKAETPPVPITGDPYWLKYLYPQLNETKTASNTLDASATTAASVVTALLHALSDWLTEAFPLATVGEAITMACHGPVGYFGSVDSYVLERTGQADLAIEATLLAQIDDTRITGKEPTTSLRLYGERFGLWLLHRQTVKPVRPHVKNTALVMTCEVLMADTAAALIQIAGLGSLEKRLFQQAGILHHATLWQDAHQQASPAAAGIATDARTPQQLDISQVADRSRRYLQTLVALVQQGKLDTTDLDLLLKTARQLSKKV